MRGRRLPEEHREKEKEKLMRRERWTSGESEATRDLFAQGRRL